MPSLLLVLSAVLSLNVWSSSDLACHAQVMVTCDPAGPVERLITSSVVITCTLSGHDSEDSFVTKWSFEGQEIDTDRFTDFNLDDDPPKSKLALTALTLDDSGLYTCIADRIGDPDDPMDTVVVNVRDPPVAMVDAEFRFAEGETATLSCSTESLPAPVSIKWTNKDSEEVLLEETPNPPNPLELILPNVTREESGKYICTVSNELSSGEATTTLVVLYAPTAVEPEIDFTVMMGDTLSLECTADGQEAPSFSWEFMGSEVTVEGDTTNRTTFEPREGSQVLRIKAVGYDEDGLFTCTASNSVGMSSVNFTVIITGAPEFREDSQSVVTVGEKSVATIPCDYRSNPRPNVTWFSIDDDEVEEEILVDGPNSLFSLNKEDGSLVINKVQGSQTGCYRCFAENVFGNDTTTLELIVIEPPLPPRNLVLTSGGTGFSVALTWEVSPSPPRQEVDKFVVELSTDDGETYQVSDTCFQANETSGVVPLAAGMKFLIRLRAKNLGGFGDPSNAVGPYMTMISHPELGSIEVLPQSDGTSVLITWEVLNTGGAEIEYYLVMVTRVEDLVEDVLNVSASDVPDNSFLVMGLLPETEYSFSLSAINVEGPSPGVLATTNTTQAPPARPTKPELYESSVSTLTLNFFVAFEGSYPITHFILYFLEATGNINETVLLGNRTFLVNETDVTQLSNATVDPDFPAMDVLLLLRDLDEGTDYNFVVQAVNSVGPSEDSDRSDSYSLENSSVIYFIVAGVVALVILAIIAIVLVMVAFCSYRHYRQGRTLKISTTATVEQVLDASDFPYYDRSNIDGEGDSKFNVDSTDFGMAGPTTIGGTHGSSHFKYHPQPALPTSPTSYPSSYPHPQPLPPLQKHHQYPSGGSVTSPILSPAYNTLSKYNKGEEGDPGAATSPNSGNGFVTNTTSHGGAGENRTSDVISPSFPHPRTSSTSTSVGKNKVYPQNSLPYGGTMPTTGIGIGSGNEKGWSLGPTIGESNAPSYSTPVINRDSYEMDTIQKTSYMTDV